jgi:small subunit ribosomal protein S2
LFIDGPYVGRGARPMAILVDFVQVATSRSHSVRRLFVPIVHVDELIEAGVHYGHRSSRWDPRMRNFIYGKRNLIHIVDLRETVRGLIRAYRFLSKVAAQGSLILFVGTKRQAQESIQREAGACSMPYVSERWIGGMFTNFRTIRSRLRRLEELEDLLRTGEIHAYSKKRKSTLMRELRKIRRNLSGIRTLNRMPGAMVVIDAHKEATAIREARKMGVPVIALVDTDSNPEPIDLVIPGNDDSVRAIDLVLGKLAQAVKEGLSQLPKDQQEKFQNDFIKAHEPVVMKEALSKGPVTAPAADATPEVVAEPAVAAVE